MQWPHCSIYVSSGVCIEYNLLANCMYLVTVCLLFCPFASLQKNLRCAAAAKWEVTKSHWPRCNATAIPEIWKFYINVNVNLEIKKLWNIQALLPPPNKRQSANKSSSFLGQNAVSTVGRSPSPLSPSNAHHSDHHHHHYKPFQTDHNLHNCLQDKNCRFDSRTLKKMLTPVGGATGSDSPLTSPVIVNFLNTVIIITRPKPAYGRQGLAGSWGQDRDEVSTFLVFLTSHFAPAALSSDLNNLGP